MIALAGCGNAQGSAAAPATSAATPSARIVPLTGDVAEIVFKLGLADKVVGVDLSAMGLPEAKGKARIGYQRALAAEGILSLKPSVLVGTEDAGPPPVIEQLKGAGMRIVLVPTGAASVDEVPGKIEQVAEAVREPGKGAALAAAGAISFVGLVVPHLIRLVAGPGHRVLLPASALAGGCVLVLADLVARTVGPPAELPIGVLTALMGGPFFLVLLRRTRRRQGGRA